jgi:cation diffusion facilitator CzcD-associated flavoprotein CzcO
MTTTSPRSVVIVGSGFGGIAAAIELQNHGYDDIVLLEAAPELGGTWHHNSYPGAACDVPSHLYSYSFAQRADWSRLCSPQAEILAYLHEVADRHGVSARVVTDTRVTACEWDDTTHRWTVRTEGPDGAGQRETDAVVLATGQLNQPAVPRIEGLETFAGHAFHSARWDHDYDLTGKRVAVIGTGASAVQFVPPVAERAGKLSVFQRSGNWFMPRKNHEQPPWLTRLLTRAPALRRLWRWFWFEYTEALTLMIRHPRTAGRIGWLWSTLFMRMQLKDPELRRRAWPDYRFGCKRVLFSSHYLPALQRENVELVTDAIVAMTPAGPRTADGRVHEVDCIVWGTGFRAIDFMLPMRVAGTGGQLLQNVWKDEPHAHLGISVPGFPSLFVLYGPNTNTSGGSIVHFLEAQAGYVRRALDLTRAQGADALDIRPEVEHRSDTELQARFPGTAWTQCDSWYRDDSGRIVTNWPGYMRDYAARTRDVVPEYFEFIG